MCCCFSQVMQHDLCLASRAKRIYANAHTYHINSISVNSDQQTFLSADDLRINLWNLDVTDQSFNIVDIKPPNMDDLTEVSRPVLSVASVVRKLTVPTWIASALFTHVCCAASYAVVLFMCCGAVVFVILIPS
jgi:hypothetical protein